MACVNMVRPNEQIYSTSWYVFHDVLGHHGSLVPRPLPDFISQLWRKLGGRPGAITMSWAGNGRLV